MRSLVLLGAWTLVLSHSFHTTAAKQDVNPAGLIPLLSHKSTDPATPATTIDPREWNPDEPSAVPDSSSSSSQSSSSSSSSTIGSSSDAAASSSTVSSSGDEDIIAPESVRLPALSVSTSASASASSTTAIGTSTSSTTESACAGTQISVETVVGVFCIEGNSICSGINGDGECPGVQPGLPTGSHCAEVWHHVYGCRPGPKSSLATRLRQ